MDYYYYYTSTPRVGALTARVSASRQLEEEVRASMPVLDFAYHNPPPPGTGRLFPQAFVPPSHSSLPEILFPETPIGNGQTRFVNRDNDSQFLIYTDGACANNGYSGAKGGWAFVYGPRIASDPARCRSIVGGRLEPEGPYRDICRQTNNRAELRAVIAALEYRCWSNESAYYGRFESLVIATDSSYVAKGATEWAREWICRDWRKLDGSAVQNQDLWKCLLGQIARLYDEQDIRVKFWWIPREWNTIADAAAKIAANKEPMSDGRFVNWACEE